jgi:paraquat-inducible protein B
MKRDTLVGAFVLGGIILGVAAAVLFGNFNIFNPSVRAVVVFQDSVSGLSIGAPVTFRGVPLGAVDGIGIEYEAKTNTAFIPVTVRLDPSRALIEPIGGDRTYNLEQLIKRGLRAELNVQSFVTGQSQIDLDFYPGSATTLHPEVSNLPEIPTRQSALQRARDQLSQLPLHELIDNASATLQSLRGLAEKLNQALPPLVDSLKTASERATGTMASADEAMKSATDAIHSLQGKLDTTLGAITTVAVNGDKQLTQRSADLHTLLTTSSQTMAEAREVLDNLKTVTSSRAATRQNLESAIRDLAAMTASLRGFASDIERNPQLLLTGRKP